MKWKEVGVGVGGGGRPGIRVIYAGVGDLLGMGHQ